MPTLHRRFVPVLAAAFLATAAVAQSAQLLGDLRPGPVGAMPSAQIHIATDGRLTFFNADDGQTGIEPWCTDGTSAGTQRLADLLPGPGSSGPSGYTGIGAKVVFNAFTPLGYELCVSDGTPAGTHLLVDLRPGFANSNPYGFVVFRDEVLFVANDGGGERVWRTDGTAAGTYPHAVLTAMNVATPLGTVAGDKLYFERQNGSTRELLVWDGAVAPQSLATFQLAFVDPLVIVAAFGGRLVFVPPASGLTPVWATDGTAAGTVPITNPCYQPRQFAVSGDQLGYVATGIGTEVRATDGTVAGDGLLVATSGAVSGLRAAGDRWFFNVVVTSPFPFAALCSFDGVGVTALGPPQQGAVSIGERLAFVRTDLANGKELWLTDGTAAGTALAVDVRPGSESAFGAAVVLHYGGGRITTWATDGIVGNELYAIRLGAGTRRVGDGCGVGPAPELRATDPVLGGNLVLSGRTSLPATPGFVAIGPLALVPAFLGSGCDVHVDLGFEPILWPFATDASGAFVAAPIPLPNASFLADLVFAGQALLPQAGAPLFGLALSNAVELTLGP